MEDEAISGIDNGSQVVVERLVMFMEDGGVRVVSGEEDHIFERMSAVIWSDEWV